MSPLQGRLWPRTDEERQKAIEAGYDVKQVQWAVYNSASILHVSFGQKERHLVMQCSLVHVVLPASS